MKITRLTEVINVLVLWARSHYKHCNEVRHTNLNSVVGAPTITLYVACHRRPTRVRPIHFNSRISAPSCSCINTVIDCWSRYTHESHQLTNTPTAGGPQSLQEYLWRLLKWYIYSPDVLHQEWARFTLMHWHIVIATKFQFIFDNVRTSTIFSRFKIRQMILMHFYRMRVVRKVFSVTEIDALYV